MPMYRIIKIRRGKVAENLRGKLFKIILRVLY